MGAPGGAAPPDAVVAVHSSRLVLAFDGRPDPAAVAEYRRRRLLAADRDRAAFITAMGINRELDALIRTVKFESLHVLTRSELYGFGIDTRPLAETNWTLEKEARPFVRKMATTKESASKFRTMELRLSCENSKGVPLTFASEVDETARGKSTILIAADTEKVTGGSPLRFGKYEVWRGNIDADMVNTILASRSLQVRETTQMPDDKTSNTKFEIDLTGLPSVWDRLRASCASPAAGPASLLPAMLRHTAP